MWEHGGVGLKCLGKHFFLPRMRHVLVDLRFQEQGLRKQRTAVKRIVQVAECHVGRHEPVCFQGLLVVLLRFARRLLGLGVGPRCNSTEKGQKKPPRKQRGFHETKVGHFWPNFPCPKQQFP